MGKRIISQARGKGSLTYRVKKKAFTKKIALPRGEGEAEIVDIVHSPAHSAPLMKISFNKKAYFLPAFNGAYTTQKISLNGKTEMGDVTQLKALNNGTQIFNIERNPNDGGKFIRTAGSSATLYKKLDNGKIVIQMPNKKQVTLNGNCRAIIGVIAGAGMTDKPFVKAGKKYYKMKAKSKLWPRVSAVAVNAVDHPFGSGRGKRVKSKIAKRNAPPGRRVGHIRPRKTGHKR